MRYFPNDPQTRQEMLQRIGVSRPEDLFAAIPANLQLTSLLNISAPRSEYALLKELKAKAASYPSELPSFLGAGVYRRFIPSAIAPIVSRAEFLTAYTPYQPEVSQGTLQAMFEFQTMLSLLTGMEVANASMYEGASATAEAVMMAKRVYAKGSKVLVSAGLHPEYLETLRTYLSFGDLELVLIPLQANGQTDLEALKAQLDETALCSVLQRVNFYGVIEDASAHAALLEGFKALNIEVLPEMTALGLLKTPGELGVDIFVGEGQSLGLPVSYGGPNLGVFACKAEFMRKMPGRLSGMTEDSRGERAFCLTLSTREQHIRREKATSNICSNQALMALWVTIYLSLLGKSGLRQLAQTNLTLADYARQQMGAAGLKLRYSGAVYNEFVLELPCNAGLWVDKIQHEGLLAGVNLNRFNAEDESGLLLSFTELNSKQEIDLLVSKLKELL
ncbi:MAG: aminomethyl-transferring glycine dehydrogenase subunit GcvPA [bacterium]|nr:aminomethyl-transferring glycine dehydrogenase subunit GcvPA [bacterium]